VEEILLAQETLFLHLVLIVDPIKELYLVWIVDPIKEPWDIESSM
jgi:hypothetical protein